jgi:hypothetical protein
VTGPREAEPVTAAEWRTRATIELVVAQMGVTVWIATTFIVGVLTDAAWWLLPAVPAVFWIWRLEHAPRPPRLPARPATEQEDWA